jgi:hypothetical protein
MNPTKIVIHEVEGYGASQVIHLLGESICKPGKSSHVHPIFPKTP